MELNKKIWLETIKLGITVRKRGMEKTKEEIKAVRATLSWNEARFQKHKVKFEQLLRRHNSLNNLRTTNFKLKRLASRVLGRIKNARPKAEVEQIKRKIPTMEVNQIESKDFTYGNCGPIKIGEIKVDKADKVEIKTDKVEIKLDRIAYRKSYEY